MAQIKHRRSEAAKRQSYRCHYCELPMCTGDPGAFTAKHGIRLSQARWLVWTAEHLVERCRGGTNAASNIVAACFLCNNRRSSFRGEKYRDASCYRKLVQDAMAAGTWHSADVTDRLRPSGRRLQSFVSLEAF
jgi:hypothetical protein